MAVDFDNPEQAEKQIRKVVFDLYTEIASMVIAFDSDNMTIESMLPVLYGTQLGIQDVIDSLTPPDKQGDIIVEQQLLSEDDYDINENLYKYHPRS